MTELNVSKSSCELIYSSVLMALMLKEQVSRSSHQHVLNVTSLSFSLATDYLAEMCVVQPVRSDL